MTQLPSVSELLIGAQTPNGHEARRDSQLPLTHRDTSAPQKKPSSTSPRQMEAYVDPLPVMHALAPPMKVPRAPLSLHAYPGTTATGAYASGGLPKDLISGPSGPLLKASEPQPPVASTAAGAAASTSGSAPVSGSAAVAAVAASAAAQSSLSSGRNLISSIGLDPHGPLAPPSANPSIGSQSEYLGYKDGSAYWPRHSLRQLLLLLLLLLLPQLHYRHRFESQTGLVTRATLFQSYASLENVNKQRGNILPVGELPTFATRPRPASFSFAPGPAPMSAPSSISGAVPEGSQFAPPPGQPYHHQQHHHPHQGPSHLPPAGYQVPVPPHQTLAHFQPPLAGSLAYYNGTTAGSGYAPNYYPPASFPGHYPGPAPGSMAGPYPGGQGGPQGPGHVAYSAQIPSGHVPYAGHEYYTHTQYRAGLQPGPYLHLDPTGRPHSQIYQDRGSHDDLALLATDPNHALINKRCIIKRRTRTGCLTCRKRRIKCDERKPHCFNCERSKKLCLGYEILTNSNTLNFGHMGLKLDSIRSAGGFRGNGSVPIKDEQPPVVRARSSVHDLI